MRKYSTCVLVRDLSPFSRQYCSLPFCPLTSSWPPKPRPTSRPAQSFSATPAAPIATASAASAAKKPQPRRHPRRQKLAPTQNHQPDPQRWAEDAALRRLAHRPANRPAGCLRARQKTAHPAATPGTKPSRSISAEQAPYRYPAQPSRHPAGQRTPVKSSEISHSMRASSSSRALSSIRAGPGGPPKGFSLSHSFTSSLTSTPAHPKPQPYQTPAGTAPLPRVAQAPFHNCRRASLWACLQPRSACTPGSPG